MDRNLTPVRLSMVVACVLIAASCWVLAFHREFFSRVSFDDDNLFYLYTAEAVANPSSNAVLAQRILTAISDHPELEALRFRNKVKFDYYDNYQLLSWTWYGLRHAREALCPLFSAREVCLDMGSRLSFGELAWFLWLSAAAWSVICLGLSYRVAGPRYAVELTCALVAAYALTFLPEPSGAARLSLNTKSFVQDTFYFIISNPFHYGIFSFEARGLFAFALVPLFLMRWRGMWWQSYAWLLVALLLHRTNGGIVALMLVAVDLTLRPKTFLDWRVLVPLALVAIQSLLFDDLLAVAGLDKLAVGVAAIGGLALLAGVAWRAAGPRLGPVVGHIYREDSFVARSVLDLVPISLGFYISLVLLNYIWRMEVIDPLSGRYAWLQLHSRTGILMLAPFLVGAAVIASALSKWARPVIASAAAIGLAVLVATDASSLVRVGFDWQKLLLDHRGRTWNDRIALAETVLSDTRNAAAGWARGECIVADQGAEMPWFYGITLELRGVHGFFPSAGTATCLTIPVPKS